MVAKIRLLAVRPKKLTYSRSCLLVGSLADGGFVAGTALLFFLRGDDTPADGAAHKPALNTKARNCHRSVVKADCQAEGRRISPLCLEPLKGKLETAAHSARAQRHVTDGLLCISRLRRPFDGQPVDAVADEPHFTAGEVAHEHRVELAAKDIERTDDVLRTAITADVFRHIVGEPVDIRIDSRRILA